MTDEDKILWYTDACGYMVYCLDHGVTPAETLLNLSHDIIGIERDKKGFSPRLKGYAKFWKG